MTATDTSRAALCVRNIFATYGSKLHRFLRRRLRAGEDADDLAQEVYLRLLRLQRTDLIRQPAAYVYFLASQVLSESRTRDAERPLIYDSEGLEQALAANTSDPWRDELNDREHAERELRRLLAKLNAAHRTILMMRRQEGFSFEEIATKLNMSVFKVKRYFVEANATLGVTRRPEKGE
jgi:RNA polymerase sigma-19 factor, ECF subfamily